MSVTILILSSSLIFILLVFLFFFFNDTATTEIYTLSLHDALPIFPEGPVDGFRQRPPGPKHVATAESAGQATQADRKSTRLNSSHGSISYAVFCLKKKKKKKKTKSTQKTTTINTKTKTQRAHTQAT